MPDAVNNLPVTVDDIETAPDNPPFVAGAQGEVDDYKAAFVRVSGEKEALLEKLERTEKRVRTIEILDELIEPMATRAFWFMCAYCGSVAILVALHGSKFRGFSLPESVLQFLVGSTATTVIGLVGMVLTGIFVGARKSGSDVTS